jgi:hypothetical protein
MAGLTSGLLGGIISTLLIVILGEILPQVNQRTKTPQVLYHKPGGARDTPMLSHSVVDTQAACSRHGLFIGANALWLVKLFIIIMFPVAWPISLVLDRVRPSSPVSPCVTSSSCPSTCLGCLSSERGRLVGAHALSLTSTLSLSMLSHWAQVLGREIGTVYNSAELKKLINIHVENPDAAEESGLTAQDQRLLTGALEYKDKQVCSPAPCSHTLVRQRPLIVRRHCREEPPQHAHGLVGCPPSQHQPHHQRIVYGLHPAHQPHRRGEGPREKTQASLQGLLLPAANSTSSNSPGSSVPPRSRTCAGTSRTRSRAARRASACHRPPAPVEVSAP